MATTPKTPSENSRNSFQFIDSTKVKAAQNVLRSMNHKLRLTLLTYIDKKGTTNVTDLYNDLNLEQSVASQHLAILRREKIVNAKRDGKQIRYAVNYERIKFLMKKVEEII